MKPAGLDRKPERPYRRAAHVGACLVQEYLNLHDELYGLVTNGRLLRLLRDSSRLIKLTYLEFDLDRIFTDGLFADFAVLYRLLHATRLPLTQRCRRRKPDRALPPGFPRFRRTHPRRPEPRPSSRPSVTLPTASCTHRGQRSAARSPCRDGKLTPEDLLPAPAPPDLPPALPDGHRRARSGLPGRRPPASSARSTTGTTACSACAGSRKSATWPTTAITISGWPCWPPSACSRPTAPARSSASPRWPVICSARSHRPLGRLHARQRCAARLPPLARASTNIPTTARLIRVNYAALNVEEFGSVYEGLAGIRAGLSSPTGEPRRVRPSPRAMSAPPPAPTTRRTIWSSRSSSIRSTT